MKNTDQVAFHDEIKQIELVHKDELYKDLNLYFDIVQSSNRPLRFAPDLPKRIRDEITVAYSKAFTK
jgi:hypothetical protein